MISRLVLNLRTFNTLSQETTTSGHGGLSASAFAQNRILGNIGAPLESDHWSAELFDEDAVDIENPEGQGIDGYLDEDVGNPTETMVPVVSLGLCTLFTV